MRFSACPHIATEGTDLPINGVATNFSGLARAYVFSFAAAKGSRAGDPMFKRSDPDIDGDTLVARAESITSAEDFENFARLLTLNFRRRRKEWENDKLVDFLEAISSFSRDFDGYVRSSGVDPSSNPWRLAATVLLAAKVYE